MPFFGQAFNKIKTGMSLPFKQGIEENASAVTGRISRRMAARQMANSPAARSTIHKVMTPKSAMMGRMPDVVKPTMSMRKKALYGGIGVVGTSAAVMGLRGKSSGGTGQITSQNQRIQLPNEPMMY